MQDTNSSMVKKVVDKHAILSKEYVNTTRV